MTANDYYNHVVGADRNRSLMARILINTMTGAEQCPVDLSELRQLSQHNRIMTDAFLDWRDWNPATQMYCGGPIAAIAKS